MDKMIRKRRVYTTGQIAVICSVAPRTVSGWFDSGLLSGYRIPGSRDRRIPHDILVQFLRKNGMPIPPEFEDEDNGGEDTTES